MSDLFRGATARTTLHTTAVCALGLSTWWLFLFWHPQHLRTLLAAEGVSAAVATQKVSAAFFLLIFVSTVGNFFASWLAKRLGNPRAIAALFLGLGGGMVGAFAVERNSASSPGSGCPS